MTRKQWDCRLDWGMFEHDDSLVESLLPAREESLGNPIDLVLPVFVRHGNEEGGVRVVGLAVYLKVRSALRLALHLGELLWQLERRLLPNLPPR